MKKIISLIAASTLAFALVSCNGDLHDDTNAPYTDAAQGKETEAYICGGLNGAKFEKMTKNEDGSFSYQYKYNGTDGWGGKEGESHFTIVSAADYDCYKADGYRWQLPDGVKAGESADLAAYEYDNHIVVKGLTKDAAYKITVNLETKGGKIKVDSAVLPTPFYLNGAYITGCEGTELTWEFPKDQLLWNPVLTEGTGELLYYKDIEAKADSHDWHPGAEGVIKISSPGWKNVYGKTAITVGQDFVELESVNENAPITGMTAGKAYRIEIKTTPEQKVFAKVYEVLKYTVQLKVVGFEADYEGYGAVVDGSWSGWTKGWTKAWGKDKKFSEVNGAIITGGEALFTLTNGIAKAGEKLSLSGCGYYGAVADDDIATEAGSIKIGGKDNFNIELTIDKAGTYVATFNLSDESIKVE